MTQPSCVACRTPDVPLREICGLLLCEPCSRGLRQEIALQAQSRAGVQAEHLAARIVAHHVPLVERDPLERVIVSTFTTLGLAGLVELLRVPFRRHVPGVLIARVRELAAAHEVAIGTPGEERALYAAGLAAARSKAARSLSAAIDLLADPASDLRSVVNEIRDAVDLIREAREIMRADAWAERGELPVHHKRRRVVHMPPTRREVA